MLGDITSRYFESGEWGHFMAEFREMLECTMVVVMDKKTMSRVSHYHTCSTISLIFISVYCFYLELRYHYLLLISLSPSCIPRKSTVVKKFGLARFAFIFFCFNNLRKRWPTPKLLA